MSLTKYNNHLFQRLINSNITDNLMTLLNSYIPGLELNTLKDIVNHHDNDKYILDILKSKYGQEIEQSSSKYMKNVEKKIVKRTNYIVKILRDYHCDINNYLDIGATNCAFANVMGHKLHIDNKNIHGIDIESWMNREYKKSGKCQFQFYDGKHIPFDNNSFDLITIFQTLHHIPNMNNIIDQIKNKLIQNKYLVIREHNAENENEVMLNELEHVLDESFLENNSYEKIVQTHYAKYYSMNELTNILKRYGFKLIRYFNVNVGPTKYYNAIYKLNK